MRGPVPPLIVLTGILALCLWNGHHLTARTEQWQNALSQAESLAIREDWGSAADTLSEALQDWRKSRTYLHVVCRHDMVNEAEDLYRRCAVLARQEHTDLFPELESLRGCLHTLAETEQFAWGNLF